MKVETIVLNKDRNVTLTANLLQVDGEFHSIPNRPAILVIPGGGYQICSDREADPVALQYSSAGYHTFILRYSLQTYAKWPNPLEDYEQAMSMIREKADEWHIYPDKIAVIGFSAGGHLAACAATMSKNKPNAAILGYPVILEASAHTWEATAPDASKAVDKKTCPCFIFATRNDSLVPVDNSLQFVCALAANNISFETHIYAYGPHGISTGDNSTLSPGSKLCNRAHHWVNDSIEWLKDMFGEFGNGSMTQPTCSAYCNGNSDDYLSIDCTMGYLQQNPQAAAILSAIMSGMSSEATSQADTIQTDSAPANTNRKTSLSLEQIQSMTANMPLRDMLAMRSVSTEDINSLNHKLTQIPNK